MRTYSNKSCSKSNVSKPKALSLKWNSSDSGPNLWLISKVNTRKWSCKKTPRPRIPIAPRQTNLNYWNSMMLRTLSKTSILKNNLKPWETMNKWIKSSKITFTWTSMSYNQLITLHNNNSKKMCLLFSISNRISTSSLLRLFLLNKCRNTLKLRASQTSQSMKEASKMRESSRFNTQRVNAANLSQWMKCHQTWPSGQNAAGAKEAKCLLSMKKTQTQRQSITTRL